MSELQTKAGNQEYSHKVTTCKLANWSLGHAEQLLFSCLCSKVTVCKLAKLAKLQMDPWDMLNNFCFHFYAQKSLSIAEKCNGISTSFKKIKLTPDFDMFNPIPFQF